MVTPDYWRRLRNPTECKLGEGLATAAEKKREKASGEHNEGYISPRGGEHTRFQNPDQRNQVLQPTRFDWEVTHTYDGGAAEIATRPHEVKVQEGREEKKG
ncbi:hypothetical protein JYU34_010750 [Plutella xylostella]|uniref:Uncharacterized protein n=1 Tax=Plutella xylostella TaxID=51655 RepID=A0ABQ7QIU0_PLUXY|nr:hypothetical protein JYU34_010750 [Plutella xylostella]